MNFVDSYRPTRPETLVGKIQREKTESIVDFIREGNKIAPTLFIGESGTGKTTIAKIIAAEYVGEENLNDSMIVEEVNSSADRGIGFVRDRFRPSLSTAPMYSKYRVWFFNEIHGWTKEAQNALLEDLENLPEHIIIIATTSEPNKIIPALYSRFQTHKLPVPSRNEQLRLIKAIAKREDIELTAKVENDLLDSAGGNLRTLVNNLDLFGQGSFQVVDDVDEEGDLFKELFFANPSLAKLFSVADTVTDYQATVIKMSHAAITMIKRGNKNAPFVLEAFGEGLSNNTSPKASFYTKLMYIHRMKNNG